MRNEVMLVWHRFLGRFHEFPIPLNLKIKRRRKKIEEPNFKVRVHLELINKRFFCSCSSLVVLDPYVQCNLPLLLLIVHGVM
jgi:hypothetical protein